MSTNLLYTLQRIQQIESASTFRNFTIPATVLEQLQFLTDEIEKSKSLSKPKPDQVYDPKQAYLGKKKENYVNSHCKPFVKKSSYLTNTNNTNNATNTTNTNNTNSANAGGSA